MSKSRKLGDMSMFSHIPIHPQWFMRLAAFQSENPHIVRGAIHMLTNAFHNEQCGTIPNTVEAIAFASHLPTEIVKQHLTELTTGWSFDRRRKNLIFEPMADMAKRLDTKFPEALQDMQERAIIAISSPDLVTHELLENQGAPLAEQLGGRTVELAEERMQDTKVRRVLPEGARMSPNMKAHLIGRGFTEDMHEDMWNMFYSHHKSNNTASASWESEFVTWVFNQIRYGKIIPAEGEISPAFKATEAGRRELPSKIRQVKGQEQQRRGFILPPNRKVEQGEQLQNNAAQNLENARVAISRIRGDKI